MHLFTIAEPCPIPSFLILLHLCQEQLHSVRGGGKFVDVDIDTNQVRILVGDWTMTDEAFWFDVDSGTDEVWLALSEG
jgi:hypothetical protein